MAQTPEEVAARQAIEAQHLARDDRLLASERATVDSAKLVSTFVADRGFSSEHNRRYLRQGDHAYIIGEKLRSDSPEIKAALSRQGRYTDIAENMRVKEVKVSDTERFVICHNPDAATRDAHIREQLVAQLEELIAGSDTLPAMKRGELRGKISTKPGLNRYLRVTPGGLLRVDKAKMQDRGEPGREVPAALLGPAPARPPTSRWATSSSWRSNAAGGT